MTILFFLISPLIFRDFSPGTQNYTAYVIFFLFLILVFFQFLISPRLKKISNISLIDLIPLVFIIIWVYGFILGMFLGNDPIYVVRNFAGMVIYVFYYVMMWQNISRIKLLWIIIFSGCIYIIFAFFAMGEFLQMHGNLISIYGFNRVYFNVGTIVIFPLLLTSIVILVYKKKDIFVSFRLSGFSKIVFSKAFAFILFILAFYSSILLPFSKGNILAFNFFIITYCSIIIISKKTSIFSKALTFTSIIIVYTVIINNQLINSFFFNIFYDNSPGNVERYEQIPILIKDFKFMGNGLGAIIEGYSRSEGWKYGFETTYLNLIHKFGIFSILLFIGYTLSIIIPIKRIMKKQELIISSVSLGLMGFVFPAIGNPMLYAPVACILHCSSLYFMRSSHSAVGRKIKRVNP